VPGVEAVGLVADVPLTGNRFSGSVWRTDAPGASGLTPPSDPHDRWTADLTVVSGGYFRAMGIPILRGRNFTDTDRLTDDQLNDQGLPRSGVVIVNRTFAERYFPGEDPIGRTIVTRDDGEFAPIKTIVGVSGDVRGNAIAEPAAPAVFVPHGQHPDVFVPSLIVRSSLPTEAIAGAIRARIATVNPPLLVQAIRPMAAVVSGALSRPRFNLVLLSSFALVALSLSAVGIYGVLAYLVAQRTREIGIRMALGARGEEVMRMFVGYGFRLATIGVACGLLAAIALTRLMSSLLFDVAPSDPLTLGGVSVGLIVVALLASYLPATRATSVNPVDALRAE
jgi:putative ABC transport system permease protein